MSKGILPITVDPFRSAEQGIHLKGTLLIEGMNRLTPSLVSGEGEVDVDIHFGLDEEKRKYIRCHFQAEIMLSCQRCLNSFKKEIKSQSLLGIITNEAEIENLPEHYDPVLAKNSFLNIRDLVEDELILNLPLVPMHDRQNCEVQLPVMVTKTTDKPEVEKENPFKVIEFLKKIKRKD